MAQRRATTAIQISITTSKQWTLPIVTYTTTCNHPLAAELAILERTTLPQTRKRLTTYLIPIPRVEVGESSAAAAARQPGSTMARMLDHSFVDTVDTRVRDTERRTMAAIEVVNLRERGCSRKRASRTPSALDRSEAYSRELEAWIRVLETQAYRHEWQRQDADDRAIEHIICTQALEVRACIDTLEDTGSSA
ncbi:hypothetical protein Tco_0344680 [Tanacetum coccineum]